MGCCMTVQAGTLVTKTRFGRYIGDMHPGFHCLIPCVDEGDKKLDLGVYGLTTVVDTKTKDNAFCKIRVLIGIKVKQNAIYEAAYGTVGLNTLIGSLINDVLRSEVSKYTFDETLEQKNAMADAVINKLRDGISVISGREIISCQIEDVEPDESLRKSMNSVQQQERDRLVVISKADTENYRITAEGVGIANRQKAITEGLTESFKRLKQETGLTEQEVLAYMLSVQSNDTLNKFAENERSTFLVPHGSTSLLNLGK